MNSAIEEAGALAERVEKELSGKGGTRIVTLRDEIDNIQGEIQQLQQLSQNVIDSRAELSEMVQRLQQHQDKITPELLSHLNISQ